MDPISIIGAVGSVVSIIDLVGKTISGLHELKNEWNDVDLAFITMTAQLTALNAALRKIDEWTNTDDVDPHHQLVMDLDMSINCCRFLIGKIEGHLSELHRRPGEMSLDFGSKVKMVLKGASIEELQKQIEHQTTALNLLLTACNCKTIADQKIILEKSSTRKVIKKVKEDSVSMLVHRDSASFRSYITDNLAKLSMVFSFDRDLFGSKVYESVLRGSVKERLRLQQGGGGYSTEKDRNTIEIDHRLEREKRQMRREVKVLVIGGPDSGKAEILRTMRSIRGSSTTRPERTLRRTEVFRHILSSTELLLGAFEEDGVELGIPEKEEFRELFFSTDFDTFDGDLTSFDVNAAAAIKTIWSNPSLTEAKNLGKVGKIVEDAQYFVDSIDRISQSDYVPTDEDILHLPASNFVNKSVLEYEFDMGSLTYTLYDTGSLRTERRKWMPMFENVHFLLFVVNLAGYDQCLPEDKDANAMEECLMLFESLVNSVWFRNKPVILFFNKVDEFREKIYWSPVSKSFPDFVGSSYLESRDYFLYKFSGCNRNSVRDMYFHWTNPTDTNLLILMMSSINDGIVQNSMKHLLI